MTDEKLMFGSWMKSNTDKKDKSISNYISGLSAISKDLKAQCKFQIDIFTVSDPYEIDEIKKKYLSIESLNNKNKRGNNMYSRALEWYKKYRESGEVIQEEVERKIFLGKKAKCKPKISELSYEYPRDREIVDKVKEYSNYTCNFNSEHKHFTANKNKKNYVEGHHLIPIKYQDKFEYSLDVSENIVSLCVVCHKVLHNGTIDEKKIIIENLYGLRKNLLKSAGLELTLEELAIFYKYDLDEER